MITISNLEFSYAGDGFVLQIPDFQAGDGERLAVVGPSGSGKTTLLNLIAGILLPARGRVEVDKVRVDALGEDARRSFRLQNIGFVFQDFGLLEYLSVRDNILHPFRIGRNMRLSPQVRKRARELARKMGIADKLGRKPGGLSQGEKQRTAICRALITRPRLILADEATGNLDPANKEIILDLLFEQSEQSGAAVLAVTHDRDLLPRFDRVLDFRDFGGGAG